jgi:hypothetical protein
MWDLTDRNAAKVETVKVSLLRYPGPLTEAIRYV